jgi:two-component system, chemotaxis family, response regulator Rcp1
MRTAYSGWAAKSAAKGNESMDRAVVRILLAEDNDSDIFLVRRALDMHIGAYQLLLAKDGEEAMQVLESANSDECATCPDFAILDLNLPRHTGIQVLEFLRKTPRCATAPVIIFTSSSSPQDRAEAFRLGANRYFQKPTNLAGFMKLGELVKEVLANPS